MIKMFGEKSEFIAVTNKDVFTIKIRNENNESVNYFLSDKEVKELQMLCKYHLQNKGVNE